MNTRTITLNEQQVKTLLDEMNYLLKNEGISETYKVIIKGIINKLEE